MKFDAKTRTAIYRVAVATVPLLVALGVFTNEVGGYILNIAAAILSVGATSLALKNVNPDE